VPSEDCNIYPSSHPIIILLRTAAVGVLSKQMYGVTGNVLISSQTYHGLNFHPIPAVSTLSLSAVGAPENSLCGPVFTLYNVVPSNW
jgi:hypothetical protein